jgi:hypothetical protein
VPRKRSALTGPGFHGAPALFLWWFEPNRSVSGVRKYFREGSGHLPVGEKDDR